MLIACFIAIFIMEVFIVLIFARGLSYHPDEGVIGLFEFFQWEDFLLFWIWCAGAFGWDGMKLGSKDDMIFGEEGLEKFEPVHFLPFTTILY